MAEEESLTLPEPPLPYLPDAKALDEDQRPETSTLPPKFDPSPMIGIIKRKALIKDLAAAYHAECLTLCREVLELQKRKEEPFPDTKASEDLKKKETLRPSWYDA